MSRYRKMTPGKRRALAVGMLLFFIVMIGMIAWSYSVAEHRIH